MLELLYIPEHLMRVEVGTGLGSRTWQITMTNNLSSGKHLMKDGQQVRSAVRSGQTYGCRTAVRSRPVRPRSRCRWNNGCTARREPPLPAACDAASSYRHDGYRRDSR